MFVVPLGQQPINCVLNDPSGQDPSGFGAVGHVTCARAGCTVDIVIAAARNIVAVITVAFRLNIFVTCLFHRRYRYSGSLLWMVLRVRFVVASLQAISC
jgi:hypothetical protein